jgi:hypothetical protein
LSSLDIPVRQFPLPALLEAFERLLKRGVIHFKFVDRTFNLNIPVGTRLLEFFHERQRPGLFLHFEMIPDRLPEELREWISRFDPGTLQFEIGIQSFNPTVCERISRRQNFARLEDNFRFLREQTGVHLHADLIAGLPGESLDSFARGFDRLVALRPHEIQVGILKRLRGTPITRHDETFGMVYSAEPPYEILRNQHLDFDTLQRLRRFARYWDLVCNSGRFLETGPLIWAGRPSPFAAFMDWSDWLHQKCGRRHGIALNRLAEFLSEYLTGSRIEGSCPMEGRVTRGHGERTLTMSDSRELAPPEPRNLDATAVAASLERDLERARKPRSVPLPSPHAVSAAGPDAPDFRGHGLSPNTNAARRHSRRQERHAAYQSTSAGRRQKPPLRPSSGQESE